MKKKHFFKKKLNLLPFLFYIISRSITPRLQLSRLINNIRPIMKHKDKYVFVTSKSNMLSQCVPSFLRIIYR